MNQRVTTKALQIVDCIARNLISYGQSKQKFPFIGRKDTDSFINALQRDQYSQSCKCAGQFKQSILNSYSETSMQT